MVRIRTLSFLIAAAAPLPAVAENEIDVVYAYARRERPAEDVGSAISVITAEDLEAGQFSFVADALKLAPGIVIARNGAGGGFASARLRGASSGQTLVVIDGIVMNDASAPQGGFNFANLDVVDIERIEVLRGPQSLIYGADAIGGVIAIRTKRQAPGLAVFAEGGSRGSARGAATAGGAWGGAFARATVSGARSDGISRAAAGAERDAYRTLSASLAAGADLGSRSTVSFFGRASRSRAEIDGFPPPLFTLGDTQEIEDTTDYAFAGRLSHGGFESAEPGGFAGALALHLSGVDRATKDAGVETFAAKGGRFGADYVAAFKVTPAVSIEAGGEYERTSADVSGVNETASAGAVFALAEATIAERITISAGGRRDEFSNFTGATTARVAAVYAFGQTTRLRASWGEGFRAPTLFELNFDQFGIVPNPDLRPERATGIDAGVDQRIGAVEFSATWFRQRVADQIDFDFARNGYFNIDRVESDGVEVEASAAIGAHLSARIAYTHIDARDAATGAAILRTPEHSGSASLVFSPTDRLSLSATAILNGKEADFPTGNDAFARFDMRASYRLADGVEIFGRVENLSDANYEDVSGYGEPGASAFAGVRVRRW
jgi:vitamin B12 transporter